MAQEDKFKREIDRIGLMLSKLLSMLLHKEFSNPEEQAMFAQQFRSELDIDLDAFLGLNDEDALTYLVHEKKLTVEHLRSMGNLLYEMAHKVGYADKKDVLRGKALRVYDYVRANSGGTLYLDVVYKINELRGETS